MDLNPKNKFFFASTLWYIFLNVYSLVSFAACDSKDLEKVKRDTKQIWETKCIGRHICAS